MDGLLGAIARMYHTMLKLKQWLVRVIIQIAEQYGDGGIDREIHCVCKRIWVEDNEKVDKPAKITVEKASTRSCAERFTSLTHINCTIIKRKWKKAKYWFQTRYETIPPTQCEH